LAEYQSEEGGKLEHVYGALGLVWSINVNAVFMSLKDVDAMPSCTLNDLSLNNVDAMHDANLQVLYAKWTGRKGNRKGNTSSWIVWLLLLCDDVN